MAVSPNMVSGRVVATMMRSSIGQLRQIDDGY